MISWIRTRIAISRLVPRVQAAARERVPNATVSWFGTVIAHPRHLCVTVVVERDAERDLLVRDDRFHSAFRRTLDDVGYNVRDGDHVNLDVGSQETVDRDFGGKWFLYYK